MQNCSDSIAIYIRTGVTAVFEMDLHYKPWNNKNGKKCACMSKKLRIDADLDLIRSRFGYELFGLLDRSVKQTKYQQYYFTGVTEA